MSCAIFHSHSILSLVLDCCLNGCVVMMRVQGMWLAVCSADFLLSGSWSGFLEPDQALTHCLRGWDDQAPLSLRTLWSNSAAVTLGHSWKVKLNLCRWEYKEAVSMGNTHGDHSDCAIIIACQRWLEGMTFNGHLPLNCDRYAMCGTHVFTSVN